MRVSLKWLRELVDIEMDVAELCARLDMTGTKVEAVHTLGEALDGVVIGQVLECEPHPDADRLRYCTVDVGSEEPLRIVCGATNFSAGDKVPVATVGTVLPGGLEIKKAKLRGVESHGMMCSATELGVGADASGLLVLPANAPVGEPYASWAGLSDTVLELEVTPNRPDCLSMAGVAREVAAVTGTGYRVPASEPEESGTPAGELVSVSIADPDLCTRYAARVIAGVRIGPSPDWLAERVTAAGARPINNVVDVTNYVLYELGQPLHAFDLDTIAAADGRAAIIVRRAKPGERLTTLDGQDRGLAADTLVIADPSGPVALAGVMGGEATEVSAGTVDVLLESACFDPASTSRTSRRLGLISEASLRFERGVDPELQRRAVDRAAQLIAEVAGGAVASGVVDVYPAPAVPRTLTLRPERVAAIIGAEVLTSDIVSILTSLGMVAEEAEGDLVVTVPTFRPDLEREIDLIEEVLRVWGMDRVPSTLPGGRRAGSLGEAQRVQRAAGRALRAAGLCEHIGFAFADPADADRLGWEFGPGELPVRLINPMSEEQSVMRWTLLGGLLRAVSNNQRRGVPDVHLYEIANVFLTAEGRKLPKERLMIGGVMAGAWERPSWHGDARPLDFFDGKGVLETLMDALDVDRWQVRATTDRAWLQPGRSADVVVRGDVVGWIGEVAPGVLDAFECAGPVTVFELSFKSLLKAGKGTGSYVEVPRYPAVNLDIAIVVPEDVTAERVTAAIRSAGGELLEDARLFDVYRDPADSAPGERRLPEGTKSLAFALSYRSAERTLSDEDVAPAHERLVKTVLKKVGGSMRA
ncbi:MAG: phenylalanine--tRNA ligase subunit beta [Anaerosomatales bacterium]|nr:phenylalanine--tRNA ligase subunit beta [Anaerosomatales bacterium]